MSFLSRVFEQRQAPAEEPQDEQRIRATSGAILAVDIGNVYTRAVLLDVVDGTYRFVARGEAPSTAAPPENNPLLGVFQAFDQIATASGRQLIDNDEQLIVPERGDFLGVTTFSATTSAGKPIRAVLFGLMPDVSIKSGRRAADSTYLSLVDTVSLGDERTQEQQVDMLLRTPIDLILIVGGTDGGAVDSLRRQIDTIALTYSLSETSVVPTVIYAGNTDLGEEVTQRLDKEIGLEVIQAENLRPRLDIERLDSAQSKLAALYHSRKAQKSEGFREMGGWTDDGVFPTAHKFSQCVRLLGRVMQQDVLGIDLGSASTTVSASLGGRTYLNVFGSLGMGHSAREALDQIHPGGLARWLTFAPDDPEAVQDYVWNKWLHPHCVPATHPALEIEYALAREIIRLAALNARTSWQNVSTRGFLPPFPTILLSGSTLSRPPHYGWSALLLLDALQLVGISRLLVDPYCMAPALGAIAPYNPTGVVQVLDTGAFIEVGTVISLTGRARRNEVVLVGELRLRDTGEKRTFEARYGSISIVPLGYGEEAELTLKPRRMEIAGVKSRGERLAVTGGELGLIIDARGRPIRFPRAVEQRRERLRAWQQAITEEPAP
jgi:uncharacterized protein (TIGR01319 family)